MKKITFLLAIFVMVGCSVESTEEFTALDARAKVKTAETSAEDITIPEEICAGENTQFSLNAEIGTNLQVQQYNPESGEWDIQVFQLSKSTSEPEYFDWSFPTAGEYLWRYKMGAGGFSDAITITVLNCACEESFTYEGEGDTYTFTYVPAEDMPGAELVFTFAQSVEVSGLEGWENNGNGATSSTEKITMDLEACVVYEWTVTLQKDCSGNSGNSNLWTDFKVNDLSKKGDLENIVQACD